MTERLLCTAIALCGAVGLGLAALMLLALAVG